MIEVSFEYNGVLWLCEVTPGAAGDQWQPDDDATIEIRWDVAEWKDENEFFGGFFCDLPDETKRALWPPYAPIDGEGLDRQNAHRIAKYLEDAIKEQALCESR